MTAPDQDIPAGQETPPTCFRHPTRETLVSCVRCGRPACPACLRDAAVGQQCVECVRGASAGTRRARTPFGGQVVANAAVTWSIIGISVLLFFVAAAYPSLANDFALLGYAPYTQGGQFQGIAAGQWYRLVTSALLPPATGFGGVGLFDLLINVWVLAVVGPSLEQLLGRVRFLALYLLSAIGGGVAFFLFQSPFQTGLGASAAVFGLFGAWLVVGRKLGLDLRWIVVIIAVNLAFSLYFSSTFSWRDHLGGLIVGAATSAAFAYAPRKNRTAVQVAAVAAILAVMVVLVILRSNQLTSEFAAIVPAS